MTAENLAKHRLDPNIAFWKNLKEGSDYFEVAHLEPQVAVADRRYQFSVPDPSAVAAVMEKERADEQKVAELVGKGVQPVRLVYDDGGGNPVFATALASLSGGDSLAVDASARRRLGDVSRPEALAAGPHEILLDPATGKPKNEGGTPIALAYAAAKPDAAPRSVEPAPAATPAGKAQATGPAPRTEVAMMADAPAETPLYKRMLSGIGDLFSTAPAPAAPVQQTAAAPAPKAAAKAPRTSAN
jgi:hypothetical protein